MEILAFRGEHIEYMEWDFLEKKWPRFGCVIYVSAKYDYIQYPTGMGGRLFMENSYFKEWATHLAELGTDFMAPKGWQGGVAIQVHGGEADVCGGSQTTSGLHGR